MKAIILFSGGLDSTVMLAQALNQGRQCQAITFNYGQRHLVEIEAACQIAHHYDVPHRVIFIDPLAFDHSSLVTIKKMPKNRSPKQIAKGGIPNTYVPARNTLFLAYALGQAEIFGAEEIYFGPNALDYDPYPDCRPEFLSAFQGVIRVATKQAIKGYPPQLITPLIQWNKVQIIRYGRELQAPLEMTFSCYDPTAKGKPCHSCDACVLREDAFHQARQTSSEPVGV
jgi:7-cyano-7-deazaguanine synthase